jgi:acyl-CoA synthetase (NDP forming)
MIGAGATETIVGVSVDPQLGPVTMFGLGGVFVEIMRDVAFRVGRLSATEARDMLDEVRGAALLRGARGRPLADEDALIDVLERVSHLAADLHDELAELDLNPLMVLPRGHGVMVVDALLVRRE